MKPAVLLTIIALWSLASFAGDDGFKFTPVYSETVTADFALDIFPGSRKMRRDRTLSVLTTSSDSFFIVDEDRGHQTACKTKHRRIIDAYFSPNDLFVILTTNDDMAEVWDVFCRRVYTIQDRQDGIHMGIFGKNDNIVITNAKRDNNRSKIWLLPTRTLLNAEHELGRLYVGLIRKYMNTPGFNKNYQEFIGFLQSQSDISQTTEKKVEANIFYQIDLDKLNYSVADDRNSKFLTLAKLDLVKTNEWDIFSGLDEDTQAYLRALLPGRPDVWPVKRASARL